MARMGEFHACTAPVVNGAPSWRIQFVSFVLVFVFKNRRGWPKANLSLVVVFPLSPLPSSKASNAPLGFQSPYSPENSKPSLLIEPGSAMSHQRAKERAFSPTRVSLADARLGGKPTIRFPSQEGADRRFPERLFLSPGDRHIWAV